MKFSSAEYARKLTFLKAETEVNPKTGFTMHLVHTCSEYGNLHYHDYYEIFLVLHGEVEHYVNGIVQTLTPGKMVFIRKNDIHHFDYTSDKETAFLNLAFSADMLTELFQYLGCGFHGEELLKMEYPPSVVLSNEDINWAYKQMELLNSVGLQDDAIRSYRSRVFLFKVFTRYFSEVQTVQDDIPKWLVELDAKMHEPQHFCQSAEHMVQLSGRTRAHLGRILQQHYHMTIPEYLNELRLNYLANLLLSSDVPVLDLFFECGFSNPSWTYNLFKKKYGVSPLQFRKMNRTGS